MEACINYENIEIEKVCGICLTKKDKMSPISEGLIDKLMECASVQVIINLHNV